MTAVTVGHTRRFALAGNLPGVVAVRDSKDPAGPLLAFDPQAWRSFVEFAKQS
ncbi:DUF397 domain-containing protein [Micromonospora sp. CB01531]|uniref:DUF397 domain-containing protein n=1 Tax=Micromonospora sp. CB01531 TaxID=1718947 RepID=UPI00093CB491|nr:DUF397 domain-containing protein [Micromonospora sp. CB01531]